MLHCRTRLADPAPEPAGAGAGGTGAAPGGYRGAVSERTAAGATPEDEALAAEAAYLRDTPVETILANHLFVLLQVAALRLGEEPPRLDAARLVIDTVAAVVGAGGERLGEHAELYRQALAELQQAYVRAAARPA